MGPNLIFDKSTIQSLSGAEARWLPHMYYSNITPILFLEIMADLKKVPSTARTPEQFVSGLAKKFSPINSAINVHHTDMALNDLVFGNTPEMRGKIIMGGGKYLQMKPARKAYSLTNHPSKKLLGDGRRVSSTNLRNYLPKGGGPQFRASILMPFLKSFVPR